MRKYWYILLISLLGITCQKKSLEVKIEESACKDFKLSSPSYSITSLVNCSTFPLTWDVMITMKYTGKEECIKMILIESKFFNLNSGNISNVSSTSTLLLSDVGVVVSGNAITFPYKFTFSNVSDANAFFLSNLKIHVENDQGTKSNDVRLSIVNNCQTPGPGSYTVKQTENVTSSIITITLYDDASEDGDIVNVYLNGTWVKLNYMLTNAGETFTYAINGGTNTLIVYAVNEGSSPPNTLAISINGGTKISLSPDLASGQAINIVF